MQNIICCEIRRYLCLCMYNETAAIKTFKFCDAAIYIVQYIFDDRSSHRLFSKHNMCIWFGA